MTDPAWEKTMIDGYINIHFSEQIFLHPHENVEFASGESPGVRPHNGQHLYINILISTYVQYMSCFVERDRKMEDRKKVKEKEMTRNKKNSVKQRGIGVSSQVKAVVYSEGLPHYKLPAFI